MKIIVLGAGVIGITTAYELAKSGYKVTVIDKNHEPGLETSYGNAGLIAPGHSYTWANSKFSIKLLKSLFIKKKSIKFNFQLDPNLLKWGLKFLQQCTKKNMIENTIRKYDLCTYSQKKLTELIDETKIKFHQNKRGLIYIYRNKEFFIDNNNLPNKITKNHKLLNQSELYTLEPALKKNNIQIQGGIYCQTDESGSCYHFTYELYKICKQMGVDFHFNTKIEKIILKNRNITKIISTNKNYKADLYVLSFASHSIKIAHMAGDYLPIYPIKGYSFTVPIINFNNAPKHSGIDEDNLLSFSLIGSKIRFTSIAEISGFDTSYKLKNFSKMIQDAKLLFPNSFDYKKIVYWAGLRPMTPNGSPILGKGNLNNLFYNTGHGQLGWTMCAGSAKIITNIIEEKKTEINLHGMTLDTI